MLKLNEVNTFAKEKLSGRLQYSTERIIAEIEKNGTSIRNDYLSKFDALFKLCISQQQNEEKKKAAFIHIFYLQSALYTEKFELQFQVLDKMSYLDKAECRELWRPEPFITYYLEDMKWFEQEAYQQIVGFGYPQIMDIKKKYYTVYLGIVGQFFIKEAAHIAGLSSFDEMAKEETLQIIFGGYMDRGVQIWPPLEVKVEDSVQGGGHEVF